MAKNQTRLSKHIPCLCIWNLLREAALGKSEPVVQEHLGSPLIDEFKKYLLQEARRHICAEQGFWSPRDEQSKPGSPNYQLCDLRQVNVSKLQLPRV